MSKKSAYVASVEDAEEDSGSSLEGIEGTRRYAFSEAPTSYKERPNTGKSRADKRPPPRRAELSDPESPSDSDSASTARSSGRVSEARRELERQERERDRRRKERRQRERERERERDRQAAEQAHRKARAEAKAAKEREGQKTVKKARPTSLNQSKALPIVEQYRRGRVEDPSCYGVQQQQKLQKQQQQQQQQQQHQHQSGVAGARPRAQTGQSQSNYYGQQIPTPPIAHAGWHQSHQIPSPFGSMGSFPPSPFAAGSPSVIGASPSQTAGYFDTQMTAQQQHAHLRNRFERPSSAMGYRPPAPSSYGYESYEEDVTDPRVSIIRRPSRTKKQNDEDKKRMPPPEFIPRPKSAIPPTSATPFRVPSSQHQHQHQHPHQTPMQKPRPPTTRSRVGFADQRGFTDDDFRGHAELFADASPEPSHERRTVLAKTRRGSIAYEHHGMDIMPSGRRSRRNSIYIDRDRALGTGGVSLEDSEKYLDAMKYQDDVNGGPSVPLTAETLRKANTRGGGSSRSSGSRDESDYKRSNTTGITRSSGGDTDNVTIKVSGSAVVRVQGAEIECQDGGEITFSSRVANSRYSDRASTIYQLEDSRSRVERKALPQRPRAPSQADSHSRGYVPSHAPYDPNFSAESYI